MNYDKSSQKDFESLERRSELLLDKHSDWIEEDEIEWEKPYSYRKSKVRRIEKRTETGSDFHLSKTNKTPANDKFNMRMKNKGHKARGLSNGNGLINGNGLTNGNGLINGNGLTNGNGLINGNGLTNGNGLINGNGLTNGNGLINGNSLGKGGRVRKNIRVSVIRNRGKPMLKALLIFTLLIIPIALFFYYIDEPEGIIIDGKFDDWKGITSYQDSIEDQVINSNVNLVEYRMDRNNELVSFYLRVSGGALKGAVSSTEAGLDSIQIFIDSDQQKTTGYSIAGIGADYLIETSGYNGNVIYSEQREFDNYNRDQNDWNGWETASTVNAACSRTELETQCRIPKNGIAPDDLNVYFHIGDSEGNEDFSDGVISANPGILIVRQRSIAGEILTEDLEDVLELELTARGKSITIDSILFTNIGMGEVRPIAMPMTVEKDETYTQIIQLFTNSCNPGEFIGFGISSEEDISADNATVTLIGHGAKAYFIRSPDKISIDGAFGDWADIEDRKDVDEEAIQNKNVDLNEYKISRDDKDISFYFSVQGSMMGGTRIPVSPKYLSFIPSPLPNVIEIPDISESPPPNATESILILPELIADDTMCIFLDTDDVIKTGYSISSFGSQISSLGADYMIKITGRNGEVRNNGYYRFIGTNAHDWDWKYLGSVRTGNDVKRLETQIDYDMIGLEIGDGFGVWFYAHDWNKSAEDYSFDNDWQEPDDTSYAPPAQETDTDVDEGQDEETTETRIQLRAGTFDPLKEKEPDVDQDLVSETPNGYYLVQFIGPIMDEWKIEIEELGGTFHGYIPKYTFIVKISDDGILTNLSYVRWTGNYQPAYKIQENILEEKTGDIKIDVLVFDDRDRAEKEIEDLGGVIISRWDSKLCVNINSSEIDDILSIPEVEWVERTPEFKIANDVADDKERLNVNPLWSSPYQLNGSGQIVAVCDTGIDTGVNDHTMHNDIEGRIISIYDSLGGNADGMDDLRSGHGTHVTGSVLGNGTLSSGQFKGMAPCASLVFQASEYKSGNNYFLDLPNDLNTLFQQAYDDGARIHTNSWGSASTGQYNTYSKNVDEFIWANRDMVILFAAGNEGIDANSDGIIDTDSMNAPSTAKNGITVGATENLRSTGGSQSSYGTSWPAANSITISLLAQMNSSTFFE